MTTIKVKKIKNFETLIPKKSAFTIDTPDDIFKMNTLMVLSGKRGGGKGVAITTYVKKLMDLGFSIFEKNLPPYKQEYEVDIEEVKAKRKEIFDMKLFHSIHRLICNDLIDESKQATLNQSSKRAAN